MYHGTASGAFKRLQSSADQAGPAAQGARLELKVPALLALGLVVPVAEAGCKVTAPIKCYTDPVNARVLGNPVDDGGMTQEYCAQLCSDKKMPLAGVEFSTQCMCGEAVKAGAKPSSGCTMPCSGKW